MQLSAFTPIPLQFALTIFVINTIKLLESEPTLQEIRAISFENLICTVVLVTCAYSLTVCVYERHRANEARRDRIDATLRFSAFIGSLITAVLLIKNVLPSPTQDVTQYDTDNTYKKTGYVPS